MLVLGINTAGDVCEAALSRDGVVFAQRSETMSQGHDARLAPLVGELMRDNDFWFKELDRIAVVVGPGSFTGVRVGVAFARGLSLALDAVTPAVGVTSLEALDGLPQDSYVLGLLPAKRRPPERTWWAQLIDRGRGAAEPFEAAQEDLQSLASGVDAICGRLAEVPDFGPRRVILSTSAGAAACFASRLATNDLPPPRPIYVRAPDAKPMDRP